MDNVFKRGVNIIDMVILLAVPRKSFADTITACPSVDTRMSQRHEPLVIRY